MAGEDKLTIEEIGQLLKNGWRVYLPKRKIWKVTNPENGKFTFTELEAFISIAYESGKVQIQRVV